MIEYLSFIIAYAGIIGLLEYGKTICYSFKDGDKRFDMKLKNNYYE